MLAIKVGWFFNTRSNVVAQLDGNGHAFRMEGGGTLEFRDGRVVAERVYFDTAEFLRQLGISL